MLNLLASLYSMGWVSDSRDETAKEITDRIVDAHTILSKLPDLRPGEVINEVLTDLVALCCQIHDVETVDKARRENLTVLICTENIFT
jgi:hypothetical protein